MRGDQRTAMAAAALLALGVAVTTVFAGNGSVADKPEQATPPAPTPEVTILNKHEVEGILGREVRSVADENMGRIVDVLVDRTGQVRAAIIDFGGFLGVGSRKIAVDWGALKFAHDNAKGDLITVELTRDQVKAAPEFKEGSSLVVLGPGTAPNPTPGAAPNPAPKPQAQEK